MSITHQIDKGNRNPYLVLILNIMIVWDFGRQFFEADKTTHTMTTYQYFSNINWFQDIVQFITVYILFKVLKQYYEVSERQVELSSQQEMGNIVSYYRNRQAFIGQYKNIIFSQLPNETDEHLLDRLPEGGLHDRELIKEYNALKNMFMQNFKNKTVEQIETSLKKFYPDEFIEKYFPKKFAAS